MNDDMSGVGLAILVVLMAVLMIAIIIALGIALDKNTGKYFCPECGERYEDDKCEYCPYDGTLLLERKGY